MRLVDADALIKDINACISVYDRNFEYGAVSGLVDALECVKEAQTVDATEVIRCKDCVSCEVFHNGTCWCKFHKLLMHDTCFCIWAERKQDG